MPTNKKYSFKALKHQTYWLIIFIIINVLYKRYVEHTSGPDFGKTDELLKIIPSAEFVTFINIVMDITGLIAVIWLFSNLYKLRNYNKKNKSYKLNKQTSTNNKIDYIVELDNSVGKKSTEEDLLGIRQKAKTAYDGIDSKKLINSRRMKPTIIIVLIAILVAIGILFFNFSINNLKTATQVPYMEGGPKYLSFLGTSETPKFDGIRLEYNDQKVKILNDSANSWFNCSPVGINNDYFYDGKPSIPPNSSLVINYIDFTSEGQRRLDTKQVKPIEFTIQCDVNYVNNASKFELK